MVTEEQAWKAGAPFAGIAPRPYDQAFLANVAWQYVPEGRVRFRNLWLTQDKLSLPAMFGLSRYSTDVFPRAVRCDGRIFLEDGHHRVVLLSVRGCTGALMRVINADGMAQPFEDTL